jgi:Heterokaryon incompatibility protein (HET)
MTEQLYSPLPDGYMRLLKLKHDEVRSGRVLECELVIQASPTAVNNEDTVDNVGAVLSRTGSYKHDNIDKGFNPLSYVFGDASDLLTINCNGYGVKIWRNLHDALTQIWTSWPRKLIWADALCINQDDLVEKSAQISKMGLIYAGSEALVWLGKEREHTKSAWKLIARLADHQVTVDVLRKHLEFNLKWWRQSAVTRLDETALVDVFRALRDILSRTWFHRMWTFQEIALAGSGVVMCGSLHMSWYDFLQWGHGHQAQDWRRLWFWAALHLSS